jgi:hypothetical protein
MDKEFDVVIVVGGRSGCGSPAWSENGSPYSASAIARRRRFPSASENELATARNQGEFVSQAAQKLHG